MDNKESFEIIEPEAPEVKPKRKLKRKYQPFFGHMPWRLLAIAFSAGISVTILAVIGYALIQPANIAPDSVPVNPLPSETLPVPFPTGTPTPFGETSSFAVTALPQDFIRSASWTGDSVAVISAMQIKSYRDFDSTPTFIHFSLDDPFTQAVVSPDGKHIAAYYQDLRPDIGVFNLLVVLDGSTGALKTVLEEAKQGTTQVFFGNSDRMLTWSPDSKLLVAATPDGRLSIWDIETEKVLSQVQTDTQLSAVALKLTTDHRLLAITRYADLSIGRFDHDELRIWDISNPSRPALKQTFTLDSINIIQGHFNQDGRYLALLGQVAYVEIVDTQTGQVTGKIDMGVDGLPISLTLNDTGDTIALAYRQYNNPFPAATPLPNQPGGDRVELRVSRWRLEPNGSFVSETVASRSDYLSLAGLDYLHFSGDSQTLSYISLADSRLYRWNIETGEIRPANYQ